MIVKCFTVPELLPANNSNQSCSPEEASVHVGSSDKLTSPLAAKTFYTARNIRKPSRYAY